ncbi:MAG TPA: D-alanyl-D-alanine carboxypeptidase family protein [Parvularculaceae bacterium]|nr:D-alanyl-D-alanine carboxypeptidase family protein [Parvularculaceae bacterium]
MQIFVRTISAIAAACALAATSNAGAEITTPAPYAVIMDYETGAILFEKDADTPVGPSSMSKLMTVAIVFEKLKSGELNLTDEFSVSEKAWREKQGSSMWVRVDTKIPLIDLLRGIIVQSGNDACIVIAENVSGTEEAFADLMTKKAREWGLKNSKFVNSTGLPNENQKMSTRDLAILGRKIIKDYPELYKLFAEREFTWERIRQPNRNPLLSNFKGADGLKTGHTEENGYGLVGSAIVNGERRILVVNGLNSEKERAVESERLMRAAFNDFTRRALYKPGDIAGDALVFAGRSPSVPLVTKEEISMILHRADAEAVNAKVVYEGPVQAPIADGQQIGYLRIAAGEGDAREFPLYAAKEVKAVGLLGRIGLAARQLIGGSPKTADAGAAQ